MDVSVLFRTYNSYGAQWGLTDAGRYLTDETGNYGSALAEIELIACFRSSGPPLPTLEDLLAQFDHHLERLPKVGFQRKQKRITINYESRLPAVDKMFPRHPDFFARFESALLEAAETLRLIERRLKKDDDFDLGRFTADIDRAVTQRPPTPHALLARLEELDKRQREARQRAIVDIAPVKAGLRKGRGTLWLMVPIESRFRTDEHRRFVEVITAYVENQRLGRWEGESSGMHSFDVSFAVKSVGRAAALLARFIDEYQPQVRYRISDECETLFDRD
jgi:hypothetical protein